MKENHVIVANFYVTNMSYNAIRENKILANISEFTELPVDEDGHCVSRPHVNNV